MIGIYSPCIKKTKIEYILKYIYIYIYSALKEFVEWLKFMYSVSSRFSYFTGHKIQTTI